MSADTSIHTAPGGQDQHRYRGDTLVCRIGSPGRLPARQANGGAFRFIAERQPEGTPPESSYQMVNWLPAEMVWGEITRASWRPGL